MYVGAGMFPTYVFLQHADAYPHPLRKISEQSGLLSIGALRILRFALHDFRPCSPRFRTVSDEILLRRCTRCSPSPMPLLCGTRRRVVPTWGQKAQTIPHDDLRPKARRNPSAILPVLTLESFENNV